MNNEIMMILKADPKHLAMKFLKERNAKLDSLESTGVALQIIDSILQLKKSFLHDIGDSYSGICYEDYIELLKQCGFRCGYESIFQGVENSEKEAVFYKTEGLVVYFNSFAGKFVNVARLYGYAKVDVKVTKEQENFLKLGKTTVTNSGYTAIEFCGISGVKYFTEELLRLFSLKSEWNNAVAVNFTNYMEKAENDIEIYQTSMRKIHNCSHEIKKIVL